MEEYENMTVAELKELLREASLPVSGKKSELIARLVESNDVVVATSRRPWFAVHRIL